MIARLRSWFFPTPADRVERAHALMDAGRWADARLEVLDLDHPEAIAAQHRAETELAKMNLREAVTWAQAGDDDRVLHHMELAATFDHGGLEEDFKRTRHELRDVRRERTEEARRAKEAEDARLMGADPFGVSGGPSWLDRTLPADFYDGDDEEAAARLALVVEGYAPELRASVGGLGGTFGRALLDLQDGRPDLAIQGLLELPDDVAVVRFERAQVAYAMKDPRAAARELREFANLAGGHFTMGAHHTGVFLAMCCAEAGDLDEALRVLRAVRAKEPEQGGALFAQLLEASGKLAEAETVLAGLIRKYPSDPGLYKLLARVRVSGGHRQQAMSALESALSIGHCTPGKCGYRPPDVQAMRGLAILYLEDGIEPERALDLARQVEELVGDPTWEDAYLSALLARKQGRPDAARIASALWDQTPPGDARQERLVKFLPAPA
ncbi:MAG: tetratricopeptide repeat protein [Myxococcota bacterium]